MLRNFSTLHRLQNDERLLTMLTRQPNANLWFSILFILFSNRRICIFLDLFGPWTESFFFFYVRLSMSSSVKWCKVDKLENLHKFEWNPLFFPSNLDFVAATIAWEKFTFSSSLSVSRSVEIQFLSEAVKFIRCVTVVLHNHEKKKLNEMFEVTSMFNYLTIWVNRVKMQINSS